MGRVLIAAGLLMVFAGIVVSLKPNLPWLGKLPGDIVIRRDGFAFYLPITTCLLLSAVLTLLFRLIKK